MPRHLNVVEDLRFEVVYQSPFYTVVRGEAKVKVGKTDKMRVVHAEGVSRRSWMDPLNVEQGANIAAGRAEKALRAKLDGKRVWKRIYKATDLLSNG